MCGIRHVTLFARKTSLLALLWSPGKKSQPRLTNDANQSPDYLKKFGIRTATRQVSNGSSMQARRPTTHWGISLARHPDLDGSSMRQAAWSKNSLCEKHCLHHLEKGRVFLTCSTTLDLPIPAFSQRLSLHCSVSIKQLSRYSHCIYAMLCYQALTRSDLQRARTSQRIPS